MKLWKRKNKDLVAGNPAYTNDYPTVFVHGFLGWGTSDGLDKVWSYFGGLHMSCEKELRARGYEVYFPSIGAFNSVWDRVCELYAYLFGGTIDYGKVHSEKYGHARYGMTFEHGVLEDLGTPGKHEKMNLLGHSFGAPTVRLLVTLMTEGSKEEQEGTPADELSPLFKGGQGDLIHAVTTVSGVNNGTTLPNLIGEKWLERVIEVLGHLLTWIGETFLFKIYNTGLQMWGIGPYPPESKWGLHFRSYRSLKDNVQKFKVCREDNIAFELMVDYTHSFNKRTIVNPNVYYFAVPCNDTEDLPDGTRKQRSTNLIMSIPGYYMNKYIPKGLEEFNPDDSWLYTDGLVNVPLQYAPDNQPMTDADEATAYEGTGKKPGIWYNMPLLQGSHISWMGLSFPGDELIRRFVNILELHRKLPLVK